MIQDKPYKTSYLLSLMAAIILIDQSSKWYLSKIAKLVYNHGGVFGIFPSRWWTIILIGFWIWLALLWSKVKDSQQKIALALILSAGLSNLIDRLIFQGVRDVIYYPWFELYGNVADIVIALGVIWILVIEFTNVRSNKL